MALRSAEMKKVIRNEFTIYDYNLSGSNSFITCAVIN